MAAINAMSLNAGQAYNVLLSAWNAQMRYGFFQSLMLHGEPGVGKSYTVAKLAKAIGAKLYDIRLTTKSDSGDMVGLPFFDEKNKVTVYYRPEDIPDGSVPSILFFDEITSAEPHLVPVVYGALQERRIGTHKIPDNCLIIAAGNTVDDGALAYEMNTALSDRLTHMIVVQSVDSWIKDFGIPTNQHPAVISFLKTYPDYFHTLGTDVAVDDLIATTGRSWEVASNILKFVDGEENQKVQLCGRLGTRVANNLWQEVTTYNESVKVHELFEMDRQERIAHYPADIFGMNNIAFGAAAASDKDNFEKGLEILHDIILLDEKRPTDGFDTLPLIEFRTHGMEYLLQRSIDNKFEGQVAGHPLFLEYFEEREADQLNT